MALKFLNDGYFAGKVGIGTESPGTKLHVDSVSTYPTLTLARSTTHSGISFTAGITNFTGAGADLLFDSVGNSTGFGFRTRNSSGTLLNTLVLAPSGNVGIGATSPSEKLEVKGGNILVESSNNGGGDANNNIILKDTDTTASSGQGIGSIQFYGSDASGAGAGIKSQIKSFYASDGDSSILTFSTSDSATNNQERIRITSGGNVGIGTTTNISSPLTIQANGSGNALSIIGRANGTNDEAVINFYEYGGTTRNAYIIKEAGNLGFATGTGGSASERMRITSAGGISFGSTGTAYGTSGQVLTSAGNASPTWTTPTTGTVTGGGSNTYLAKWTTATNINSSAMFQAASGNFSIGITTPNAKLSVVNDISIGTSATDVLRLSNISGVGGIYGFGSRNLAFGSITNGEVMRVDNINERVGIGTTSPDAKLDVIGQGIFQGSTTSSYKGANVGTLNINNNSADGTVDFTQGLVFTDNVTNQGSWTHAGIVSVGSTGYNGSLVFGTDGDGVRNTSGITEKMRITSGGNVGIGTTTLTNSSGYKTLSISGSAGGQIAFQTSGTGKSFIFNDATDFYIYNSEAGNLKLFTAATERMRISSTGDVGIGTSSFNHFTNTKELLIEGDVTNTNSVLQVISYDNLSSLAIYAGAYSTDDPAIIYQNDLRFGSTNGVGLGGYSEKMRITNGGNVGINTTIPQEKFVVSAGAITAIANDSAYTAGYFAKLSSDHGVNALKLTSRSGDVLRATDYGSSVTILTGGTTSASVKISSNKAVQFNGYNSTNFIGTPTYLLGTDASGNVVKTLSSTAPGSLWLANGNDIYNSNSGNVGIGTSTLNAISGTNPTLTLGGTGISGGLILQRAGTDKARLYENAGNMVHQGMTGVGHHFYVNAATQAMVIDSSGNVGIGLTPNASYSNLQIKTPSSAYGLDLVGRDAGSSSESQITFWNSNQTSVLAAIVNSSDSLLFYTGTTERMRLVPDTGSSFAILKAEQGTYSSIAALSLYGTNSSTYGGSVVVRSSILSQTDGTAFGANLIFKTNNTSNVEQERARITSTGHLQVSTGYFELTSQPTTKLWLTTNQAQLYAGGLLIFAGYNSSNDAVVVGNETGDVNVTLAGGANNKVLYLEGSSGNVGIGTKTPQSKLQVAGGIQMADDTDTASATKVGTMRYRTATNEPVAVTGIDFITNGDFATDTDWTKSSNVSISGGQATFTANSADQYIIQGSLWPANSLSGQKVQLTYTVISNSLNAGDFRIGGYTGASAFTLTGLPTTVGTHSVTLDVRTSVGDDNAIDLYVTNAATSGVFVIDNVALIEVTEEDASYADMCMQTGASTYEWVNIVRNTY